jgi:GT2 family glycosyltransferase
MSETRPRVAVVIISWNRVGEIVNCLESFPCLEYPNFEVVVVDNASQDPTVATVRERFPWATVIVNERNLGYVGGSNVGFRYALEHGADYAFLLNQDTKVTPTVLSELVRVMQGDSRIGIAGAKNLLMENPSYTWAKYGVLNWGPMLVRSVGGYQLDRPEPVSPKDVDWVIGNGCMMSREALERVGLFDEEFFHFNEDVDWSMRARKLGYRAVYVDTAAIYHKGSSAGDFTQRVVFHSAYFLGRNAIIFAHKHATRLQWAKLLVLMSLGWALRASLFAVRAMLEVVGDQQPFVIGLVDGFSGRLRRDRITVRRGRTPTGGRLDRFLRWMGL